MCSDSKLSRLCRLVDDCLRPYTESGVVLVTKEREILVTLSQLLRQVKLLTQALDSDSENGPVIGLDCESDCMCLTKIVTHLIVLLTVESQYVKHLTCNVLVAVSEFLAALGSNWGAFIHLLCVCVDLAITVAIQCTSSHLTTEADDHHSGSSSLVLVLKRKLENADWSVAAGVVRVLHDIRKYLKTEDDDVLVELFFDNVNSVLSTVPWNLLQGIHVGPNLVAQKSSGADVLFQRSLFLGNLVQFLCSLAEQSGSMEAASGSVDRHHPIISTIINLVPKLLCSCLDEQADCVNFNKCISQYFRHKLLVLMIRLIFQTCQEFSIPVTWLQLIHKYFEDVLRNPITLKNDQDDCLEGSPFLSSVSDAEVNSLSSRHLQRQAVFLFLRCSFSLISTKGGTNKKCACTTWNLRLTCDSNAELLCCGRKKGLLELYNWLQGHLPANMTVDHEMYFVECVDFAKSFIQLYIKEDDVLFKVLLHLLCVPCCAEQDEKEKVALEDSNGNLLFRVSDLFNPVLLFHLFLLELSYDHQVLLDYLISKDTGISCAEYLLRCLRKVCDSWSLFVEFLVGGQATNQSFCKKRKVSLGGSSSWGEDSVAPTKNHLTFLDDEPDEENENGCKHTQNGGQYFKEAKECLLSLKISIEGLHQKNLFPYNPNVLLNRLTRFQELCFEEEK
ncbi:hypothetical protein PRUPE_7G141900 [Prunus persica]|uniref:Protein Lines C-terminal domain-containing protein n=1 Tax=Prunus persica TaxID=3760 RepID=A0A251NEB3_PRUPE|nr:uncharacterized protein LOC18771547 [Prunus persica]ONH96624.1 hypothetical protein PRUPE_7G141900 [Prunus persica]